MSSSSDRSDASAKATTVIGTPNHIDVLFGRGAVCREHPGTKLFHAMCRSHSAEFGSSNRHEAKNIVAYRVLNAVRSTGGRFLQPCGRGYTEMSHDVALRKTKQSIRDSKNSPDPAAATDKSESWRQHQRREESRRARRQEHEQQDPRNATATATTTAPDEVDEVETQFYSLLTEPDETIPKFSAEDWRLERERMTEEERISVQKDVLGSSQFENSFIQQPIQPARSASFSLLQQMR